MRWYRRLRQAHAVEHATVAVLIERRGGRRVRAAGLSHPWGFLLAGQYSDDDAAQGARRALERLQAGDRHLATSDFCGTNIVLTALLAAAAIVSSSRRDDRSFSRAVSAAAAAIVVAPALGHELQRRVTTLADVGDRRVRSVRRLGTTPIGPLYHVTLD